MFTPYRYDAKSKKNYESEEDKFLCSWNLKFSRLNNVTYVCNPFSQTFLKLWGAPTVMQQGQWWLGSAGMQVPSPAQHSGLGIRCCHSCSLVRLGSDLIPGHGAAKKKKRKTLECYTSEITFCQVWRFALQTNIVQIKGF